MSDRRRRRWRPRRLSRDERAQMMMLTAVVLLAAFLALSATVARLNTLSLETGRERSDPFPNEFTAVQRGMEHVALRLDDGTILSGRDYTDMLDAALVDMERIEASRGYSLRATATCSGLDVELSFELQNTNTYGEATWILDLPENRCPL